MRDDPRPVNDRDLFKDRNALTGDEPEGELLGPIGTFRRRARYLALLLTLAPGQEAELQFSL